MYRPLRSSTIPQARLLRAALSTRAQSRGFTLIEVLVAMAVTLIMLGIVVTIFGVIGENVSASRATMEMTDQVRGVKNRLQLDLAGITCQMLPPRRHESGEGYFELIEGPVGRLPPNTKLVLDENQVLNPDTTVGDNDDILMFTSRASNQDEPFLGRMRANGADQSIQSQWAEIVWFVRGTTLYRRQLLVRPDTNTSTAFPLPQPQFSASAASYVNLGGTDIGPNFYAQCDISVHSTGKIPGGAAFDLSPPPQQQYRVVANTLGDLTKRENRFMHAPLVAGTSPFGWPHDMRHWGTFFGDKPYETIPPFFITPPFFRPLPARTGSVGRLGLPTLSECSSPNWYLPGTVNLASYRRRSDGTFFSENDQQVALGDVSGKGFKDQGPYGTEQFDAWTNPNPAWNTALGPANSTPLTGYVDPTTGNLSNFPPDLRTGMINTSLPVGIIRQGDDIILTNVLSFDVKVWDPQAWTITLQNKSSGFSTTYAPGDPQWDQAMFNFVMMDNTFNYVLVSQGAYVNLNYGANLEFALAPSLPLSNDRQANRAVISGTPFYGPGQINSGLIASADAAAVYDTGSWHYETDGIDQDGDGTADQGTNGRDDNANGLVDEEAEREAPPPYSTPLRGIQIKLRCFEPDSKQIREFTVVQEFISE